MATQLSVVTAALAKSVSGASVDPHKGLTSDEARARLKTSCPHFWWSARL
ncbi:hypothetical protein LGH82_05910 [Mesorhizobium sp. PAMC28654]|nr:hypothetical protein [Mesorhizobium sp. PAMC28654]UDL90826.1 hypothetical protein LGH82_05910 [Mesorhizobium sp. PAMC28654]